MVCWEGDWVTFVCLMKMLTWDVRGLGRREKRRKIKKIIKENELDIVLMQETKKEVITEMFVTSICPDKNFGYMEVGADGSSGGLLCIWKKKSFELKEACCNKNFVVMTGTIQSNFLCTLVNVYAPNDVGDRRVCWESLLKLKGEFGYPWCIGGDFNEIRNLRERQGCARRYRGMREFNEFIHRLEFVDIPLLGRRFTGLM